MRRFNKLLTQAVSVSLAMTLGVVPLVGCNKGEKADTTDATATEQAAEPKQAEPTEQPVWVVSKQTNTYTADEDSSTVTFAYERDEQGNILTMTTDAGEAGITVETRAYDEDGYYTSSETTIGDDVTSITYQLTKDDQGRLTKREGSDGSVTEYTYDADGNLVSTTLTKPYTYTDENDNSADYSYQLQMDYDASGLLVRSHVQSVGNSQISEKTYERDDQGRPVTVTTRTWSEDENGEPLGDYVDETTVSVEYDDNGNVVRVTQETEGYTSVTEYEYVQVAQPSMGAKAEASLSVL